MMTFVIEAENNIIAFTSQQEAEVAQGERFASQQELTELAATWPAGRLVEIWNSIPGLTPLKKFTDRKSGLARIWKAIQSLNGGGSGEPAHSADPQSPKKAKRADKGKSARAGKGKRAKGSEKLAVTRAGSKKATVLDLLQRKNGRSPRL